MTTGQTIWYPTMRFFSSRKAYDLDVYINHYLPAYFIDLVSKMTGKKPRYELYFQSLSP